ncbi:hypothetical protein [Enterovirga rhinocerotis]|uniref:ElaB/YqjD/DUF883 family membrane-anchored ribosome-binding protein n=1 Tax=Enterovirga rhinocerotis TaxID=1339210 RepID=A0A4R7C412_9HYPH|nr:hypothetical protein [Enterovirga rhinocerotis]TDR93240.1 hypothetical protein EV668_0496 [Enterovirga rhinocerotis]
MSEVDKHYGGDPVGLDRKPERRGDEEAATGPLDRAQEAVRDAAHNVADKASRTAEHVRDAVSDRYERASEWAHDGYESVARNATYARRRSAVEFRRGRRGVESFIDENPIMVGVAGLAAGLLIGSLLPATRRENRAFGRYADEFKRDGLRYAHDIARDVAEQGRALMGENLKGAGGTRRPDR